MLHNYFDRTLCLTQADRPDRWQQFLTTGIQAEPFYSLPHDNRFISFCNSQRALLRLFHGNKGNTLLGLEDDVVLKSLVGLDDIMRDLPEWDMIYFGCNPTEPATKIKDRVYRLHGAWTSHCIAYKRPVVEFILDFYNGWEEDGMYDDWLSRKVLPKFVALTIVPFIAWQRPVRSDLWGGHMSYGWDEMEKRFV